MPTLVPDLAEQCVDRQRRRQDVRDDRVAGRVDDRPARRHQGGDQLPEPRDVERGATSPSGPRSPRSAATSTAVAMMRAAFERRAARCTRCSSEIPGVTCLEPQGAFYCFPNVDGLLGRDLGGAHVLDDARARRPRAVGGQGGVRARRSVRRAGLRPLLVRPRRRRPRRGHHPHRRLARSPLDLASGARCRWSSYELVGRPCTTHSSGTTTRWASSSVAGVDDGVELVLGEWDHREAVATGEQTCTLQLRDRPQWSRETKPACARARP